MEANLWERREWEEPIAGNRPDLDARKARVRLPKPIRKEHLRPVFTTVVARRVVELEPHASTRIEVAFDQGEIRANGDAVEPISELELELKSGNSAVLYDLALRLLRVAKLRLEMRSKAERGYRLLGARPQPARAMPITLAPDMTVGAALQSLGELCIAHLLHNGFVALADDAEAIHQMRVAVRRLRSALSALKSMLPAEHYHWASEELKWFSHALGSARNWDVFLTDLVRPVSDALPDHRELDQLVSAAELVREAAFDNAKQAFLSERNTEAMLRLMRWFKIRGWRDQPISENAAVLLAPIVDVAPDLIERCHGKASCRCRRFGELTPAARHRLRIALKKLRYTIEFLGSLFDERRVRAFVDVLKALQDGLGHANDVRVAYDLMQQLRDRKDHNDRAIDQSGGLVLGWHERDLVDREPKLKKLVRHFRKLDSFW